MTSGGIPYWGTLKVVSVGNGLNASQFESSSPPRLECGLWIILLFEIFKTTNQQQINVSHDNKRPRQDRRRRTAASSFQHNVGKVYVPPTDTSQFWQTHPARETHTLVRTHAHKQTHAQKKIPQDNESMAMFMP